MSGINPVLDAAREHFTRLKGELTPIEVKEWGVTVYVGPPTIATDRAMLDKITNTADYICETVFVRCLDENGDRVFTGSDRKKLESNVDSSVLQWIFDQIGKIDPDPITGDDAAKNSETIPLLTGSTE